MKINLGKLLRLAGRLIVAAPAIIDAIRPALLQKMRMRATSLDDDWRQLV